MAPFARHIYYAYVEHLRMLEGVERQSALQKLMQAAAALVGGYRDVAADAFIDSVLHGTYAVHALTTRLLLQLRFGHQHPVLEAKCNDR